MTEPTASESWLYARLNSDTALAALVVGRIYDAFAGRGAAYPLVTYQFQGGRDVPGVSAVRIMGQELYLVKAVGRDASYAALKPIAKRVDELLHRASGSTADGQVYACVREQPFKLAYVEDGAVYRELGGVYRLYVAG